MYIKPTTCTNIATGMESHDFGVTDNKGRAVGAQIYFVTQVYADAAEGERGYYSGTEPGTYLRVHVSATRGGRAFGAAFNRSPLFRIGADGDEVAATIARDAYCAKYLKGAKARALKNFPPAA